MVVVGDGLLSVTKQVMAESVLVVGTERVNMFTAGYTNITKEIYQMVLRLTIVVVIGGVSIHFTWRLLQRKSIIKELAQDFYRELVKGGTN